MQIFQLNGHLTRIGDTLAAPAGQTTARWQVLAAAENGPASVADIARMLGLARQSVQRVADVLVEEGLATYEDNPQHARAKLLVLTQRGRNALKMIGEAQRVWADQIGKALGLASLKRTTADLARVLAALER